MIYGFFVSTRRRAAALLATALVPAALLLLATSAHAADTYRVEIHNQRSGLNADVMWGSTAPYQGVFLWHDNTSASQEFDLLDSGNGYVRIRARHSGQCLMLDPRAPYYTNGTRVVQFSCTAGYSSAAEWRLDWRPFSYGGLFPMSVLVNRWTGKCLDAANSAGGAPPVTAVLQQWTCIRYADDWNAGNQLFAFRYLEPVRF